MGWKQLDQQKGQAEDLTQSEREKKERARKDSKRKEHRIKNRANEQNWREIHPHGNICERVES